MRAREPRGGEDHGADQDQRQPGDHGVAHGRVQIDPRLLQTAANEVCSGRPELVLGERPSGKLLAVASGTRGPSALDRTLREQYIERYGPATVPLPSCLEDSPLVMALREEPPGVLYDRRE